MARCILMRHRLQTWAFSVLAVNIVHPSRFVQKKRYFLFSFFFFLLIYFFARVHCVQNVIGWVMKRKTYKKGTVINVFFISKEKLITLNNINEHGSFVCFHYNLFKVKNFIIFFSFF